MIRFMESMHIRGFVSMMTGARSSYAANAAGRITARLRRLVLHSKSAVTAILISLHGVAPLAAQTPADIAHAARDLPRSLDLQTEFPSLKPDEVDERGYLNADMARVLLWTVVIAGAGVLAYFIYKVLPVFAVARPPRWDHPADSADVTARTIDAAAGTAADEFAAQGRFVEAMHVLLLQGLDETRTHCDLRFADSLTSREILGRANVPGSAKVALREIIQWVERAYFGDHPVGRNDYDACRRSFVALTSVLQAGGRE
jgi:Domain of unknown function (DUF4129)